MAFQTEPQGQERPRMLPAGTEQGAGKSRGSRASLAAPSAKSRRLNNDLLPLRLLLWLSPVVLPAFPLLSCFLLFKPLSFCWGLSLLTSCIKGLGALPGPALSSRSDFPRSACARGIGRVAQKAG